jgi:hypothetical protein
LGEEGLEEARLDLPLAFMSAWGCGGVFSIRNSTSSSRLRAGLFVMASQTQLIAAMKLYRDIMVEVKVRIEIIDTALSNQINIPGPAVRELCFLQLRMICELIAFGCVIAHGDIAEASKLKKEYSAGAIMNVLETLHADFYPIPVRKVTRDGMAHLEIPYQDYLKKPDLIALNAKCGEVLHRGTLKKLLAGKIPIQTNFPEIEAYKQKIIKLLNEHSLVTLGNRGVFHCLMKVEPSGVVGVYWADAVQTPPQQSKAPEPEAGAG